MSEKPVTKYADKFNLCVNCKFCAERNPGLYSCLRPDNTCRITGWLYESSCREERAVDAASYRCGLEGRSFEAKQ